MRIARLTGNAQIISVICNQLGDSGKGKICDLLAYNWAEVVARGTGSNNAGHTVTVGDEETVFHLLPVGISQDSRGLVNILGSGVVIDLEVLCGELNDLDKRKMTYNNLMISRNAHVTMPYHLIRDEKNKSQKNGGIGSTGKGVGPAYADKIARFGVTVGDFFDLDRVNRKINRIQGNYPELEIDSKDIIERLKPYFEKIKPFVRDTTLEMHRFVDLKKRILLEGAQGLLLSVEHGTYPYVTSSDCSLNGTASGVGLSAKMVDLPLGLVKFPFMTRVGAGPFPTEFGGRKSELYCGEEDGQKYVKRAELEMYGVPFEGNENNLKYDRNHSKIREMINSNDEFIQGAGIRLAAGEYGASTGRPRRTGWVDAVAAKYAVMLNGPNLVITKPDSISGIDEFRVCYGYKDSNGKIHTEFNRSEEFLRSVQPVYTTYEGYGDISYARNYYELPRSLDAALTDFEDFTGGTIKMISVSAERDGNVM